MVATPIGNLQDMGKRAEQCLQDVDLIVCEDTRVTGKLLKSFDIQKPLASLHEHTAASQLDKILDRLRQGQRLAYVCDAGTPGVNDPGGKLVAAAFDEIIPVVTIPGPSALTAAISVCGFPMNEFVYVGFIPHKKGRETLFKHIAERAMPTIFFESTHRIEKTLAALKTVLDSDRLVFVGREMTKMHEMLYRGRIDEVIRTLHDTSLKGEFVVIIGPRGFMKHELGYV